ncbi:hypothetical protein GC093_12175 [Paenibacillus sp. LMG 31456]|uniref:Uncharacterized protein n=1 Tax=Paenibacillus foliorum TaxID=2654974 RepID=A0A972JYW7_9BACL|nr:hypothetical protein [Paenibacillus foliorum]NOU93969.1 hypothetical protein [Paenibacillus foliorum]
MTENYLFPLLQHCCDTLIDHQELADTAWQGGIRCPACRTVHGRCGDAIFPLYYMYTATGNSNYLKSARLLTSYIGSVQQPDGAWLNELAGDWKGTTVFQLLSLCHAYDLLSKNGEQTEADTLKDLIASSALWVSRIFGNGGKTNVNYYLTSAVVLQWASVIVSIPHYAEQARLLIERYGLANMTGDGFLLGEKTNQRPFSRVTSTVDIGYNMDMSLGAMAEYAILTGNEHVKEMTVHALRKHMEMIYPDGSMDNSFGSRNYKWTLFGSKTAHGCQMAFMMLCDEDPAFYKAAELNAAYVKESIGPGGGMFGYGPHYKELFKQSCIHATFNKADAFAVALTYGKEPARKDALIPSQAIFGVREYASLGVHHMRTHQWMGTVSCYHVHNAPTGGTLSYLWNAATGPVQIGSVTKYERYEPYNMPAFPAMEEELTTPRIEAVRQGITYSNLYEYEAYAASSVNEDRPEAEVHGQLKYEADCIQYDCGISYKIRYTFYDSFIEKIYDMDVRLPCEQIRIVEPIVSGANCAALEMGEEINIPSGKGNVIQVSGWGVGFQLDRESLTEQAVSVFPSILAVPLKWRTGPLIPGQYSFRVSIRLDEPGVPTMKGDVKE